MSKGDTLARKRQSSSLEITVQITVPSLTPRRDPEIYRSRSQVKLYKDKYLPQAGIETDKTAKKTLNLCLQTKKLYSMEYLVAKSLKPSYLKLWRCYCYKLTLSDKLM